MVQNCASIMIPIPSQVMAARSIRSEARLKVFPLLLSPVSYFPSQTTLGFQFPWKYQPASVSNVNWIYFRSHGSLFSTWAKLARWVLFGCFHCTQSYIYLFEARTDSVNFARIYAAHTDMSCSLDIVLFIYQHWQHMSCERRRTLSIVLFLFDNRYVTGVVLIIRLDAFRKIALWSSVFWGIETLINLSLSIISKI